MAVCFGEISGGLIRDLILPVCRGSEGNCDWWLGEVSRPKTVQIRCKYST